MIVISLINIMLNIMKVSSMLAISVTKNIQTRVVSQLILDLLSVHDGVKCAYNLCEKQYTQQTNLNRHIKYYGETTYNCNHCDKQYTEQNHLRRNIQSVHEGVKYACNQCDKQLSDQKGLKSHIQIVHEGVRYTCNLRDKQ